MGGGNSAGQAAVYLSRYAKRVLLIVRSPENSGMSQYLIDQMAAITNIEVRLELVDHRGARRDAPAPAPRSPGRTATRSCRWRRSSSSSASSRAPSGWRAPSLRDPGGFVLTGAKPAGGRASAARRLGPGPGAVPARVEHARRLRRRRRAASVRQAHRQRGRRGRHGRPVRAPVPGRPVGRWTDTWTRCARHPDLRRACPMQTSSAWRRPSIARRWRRASSCIARGRPGRRHVRGGLRRARRHQARRRDRAAAGPGWAGRHPGRDRGARRAPSGRHRSGPSPRSRCCASRARACWRCSTPAPDAALALVRTVLGAAALAGGCSCASARSWPGSERWPPAWRMS